MSTDPLDSLKLSSFQVYYISRGRLKPANKQYSSLKNDYELSFTDDTEVEPVESCFNV